MIHRNRCLTLLLAAWCCSLLAGCRWNHLFRRTLNDPPPIAFAVLPSSAEALAAINANTQRIQSLQTQGAAVSLPGAPSLSTEIALERPANLRLRAGTQLLGPELDLGSNEQLFWLWAPRLPERVVYFARHDQFAMSRARQMLPIEPGWLIQALGLVEVEPQEVIAGPTLATGNRLELRTTVRGSDASYTRLLVLDAKYAWVLEQHLFDARGQRVASAHNSGHEFYTAENVSLPKRIEVQVPGGQLSLQLDVDRWAINQPLPDRQALFELPRSQLGSHPFVDIADPNFVPPGGTIPVQQTQPLTPRVTQDVSRRHVRGFTQWR